MEYIKRSTKILVKDERGRIIQIIPETDAASINVDGDSLTDIVNDLRVTKANVEHGHEIADIQNLQNTLDGKNPLIGDVSNNEILALLTD